MRVCHRYNDPELRITPTINGRRVQRYGQAGNNPTDEAKKSAGQPSPMAMEIIAGLMQLPLFRWIMAKFEAELQSDPLSMKPGTTAEKVQVESQPVKPQEPPRQKYQRTAQPLRFESDRIDPARYAKLVAEGRSNSGGLTDRRYAAAGESRMQYQKHQASIKGRCEDARKLALDSGCTFEQAMRTLGVQSVPLPS